MAGIPQFEIGIHTTSLTLYKQTVLTDGTLQNDTSFSTGGYDLVLYATPQSVETDMATRQANLSPMTLYSENNVGVEFGATWTINGLLLKLGINPGRKLAYQMTLGPLYITGVWTHGDDQEVFTGSAERYRQNVTKDSGTFTLTMRQVALLGIPNNPSATGL